MNIGIYIYPDVEVLDFAGPFEVFSTATRLCGESLPFSVSLISEHTDVVVARGGFRVLPDYGITQHPPLDVLIIAGGVHTQEMDKPAVQRWIRLQSQAVKQLATVCTGVFIWAQALDAPACRVTTHWEDIPDLKQRFSRLEVIEGVRWVDDEALLSSGGISAGIDMSLYLVKKLHSLDLAERTARQMEFDWSGL